MEGGGRGTEGPGQSGCRMKPLSRWADHSLEALPGHSWEEEMDRKGTGACCGQGQASTAHPALPLKRWVPVGWRGFGC